ncbi:MAG: glycosyltransferase family 2 protein [Eubacteriales bacterium]
MDEIAVLIPCYNEEQTIAKVIQEAKVALPSAVIYVYDNNSTDQTVDIAIQEGAVVRRERQQGKGNVIRRMFREIEAKCYVMIDGDDTYPLEHASEMANRVLEYHADMVVGDRLSSTYYQENKRPFHNLGNSVVRLSINHLFRSDIKDIMTGYRAFSYEFVKTFPVLSKGFEIETEMTIHAVHKKMQVDNVIVDYRDRPEGSESKLNTFSDGAKVIMMIVRLFGVYKPLMCFGIVSIFFMLISIILFIPVLLVYFRTGLVPHFPTLIVAGFLAMASLQSLFSGLILHNLGEKDRRDFEYYLKMATYYKLR